MSMSNTGSGTAERTRNVPTILRRLWLSPDVLVEWTLSSDHETSYPWAPTFPQHRVQSILLENQSLSYWPVDDVPWTDQSQDTCAQRLVSVSKPAGTACGQQAPMVECSDSPKKRALCFQRQKE